MSDCQKGLHWKEIISIRSQSAWPFNTDISQLFSFRENTNLEVSTKQCSGEVVSWPHRLFVSTNSNRKIKGNVCLVMLVIFNQETSWRSSSIVIFSLRYFYNAIGGKFYIFVYCMLILIFSAQRALFFCIKVMIEENLHSWKSIAGN